MKYIVTTLVALGATFAMSDAQADNYDTGYCREYNKTVYVGGRAQDGYGTACQQQDGSWRITSGGNYGEAIDNRYIAPVAEPVYYPQTVYYPQPVYRPVAVYRPAPVYYSQPYYRSYPSTFVSFSFGGNRHNNYRYADRRDGRWDKHRWNDRGHGGGRHH